MAVAFLSIHFPELLNHSEGQLVGATLSMLASMEELHQGQWTVTVGKPQKDWGHVGIPKLVPSAVFMLKLMVLGCWFECRLIYAPSSNK